MYICPMCQAENRPTAKFCRKCGSSRPAEPSADVSVAVSATTAVEEKPGGNGGSETGKFEADASDELVEEITEEEVAAEASQAGLIAQDATMRPGSRETESGEQDSANTSSGDKASAGQSPEAADEPAAQVVAPRRGGPTCQSCGAHIRVLDKFCIWCGERQPERSPVPMKRCSDCRTQLPMTANFCFACGNDVGAHPRKKVRAPTELFAEEDPDLFPKFEA